MKVLNYFNSLLAFNQYLFNHSFKFLYGFITTTHHSLSHLSSWLPEIGSVVTGSRFLHWERPLELSSHQIRGLKAHKMVKFST